MMTVAIRIRLQCAKVKVNLTIKKQTKHFNFGEVNKSVIIQTILG